MVRHCNSIMSPKALQNSSIVLSAYGRKYYAFVFAPSLVVIYSLEAEAVVYMESFAKFLKKTICPFTSLVTFRNNFYVGLSDGRIISFLHQEQGVKTEYKCIDSGDDGLPGYKHFKRDPSNNKIELLACRKDVLIYSTESNDLVLLKPSESERIHFDYPILKLRINSKDKTKAES
ncbi:hypothetical protein DDE82_009138 [Stemphylium lycopersici]|nr:hypothetical protein DDE82_009138 [Stemphylium lycopersici]